MITITLNNNPGYPTLNPDYLGTIHHSRNGVAASVNSDYKSTWPVRRYLCGLEKPNYPVPAIRERTRAEWFWIAFTDYQNGNISDLGFKIMIGEP